MKMSLEFPSNLGCSIVLVGLMGVGKTCIGRKLAARVALPFVDADAEIEVAADCSIEEIFASHGENHFRDGERRVIGRLLDSSPKVLATGGGAYLNPHTRRLIHERGVAVWLRGDLELLLKRTSRRDNRPLLKRGNPREILRDLIEQRYPIYAEADLTVDSMDGPPELTLERVMSALSDYFARSDERTVGRG